MARTGTSTYTGRVARDEAVTTRRAKIYVQGSKVIKRIEREYEHGKKKVGRGKEGLDMV